MQTGGYGGPCLPPGSVPWLLSADGTWYHPSFDGYSTGGASANPPFDYDKDKYCKNHNDVGQWPTWRMPACKQRPPGTACSCPP